MILNEMIFPCFTPFVICLFDVIHYSFPLDDINHILKIGNPVKV
ncbi:hypothetical protein LY16_01196 [Xenorhabdus doucetiae]|uniref:Uncharacterized protein n=1 Tax=Xenorhabdus doucetiae TaxID=351671 RepID=A0ABY3NTF5_9GAMM|nr:hypothetical protein LY16_01196 [Xenorhabdus doucetiae]